MKPNGRGRKSIGRGGRTPDAAWGGPLRFVDSEIKRQWDNELSSPSGRCFGMRESLDNRCTMRQTRILLFPPARGTKSAQSLEEIKKRLGSEVVAVEEKAFDESLSAVEDEAVRAEAERWTKGAKEIVEPSAEDIQKAARVCIALERLVEQQGAQGLAVGTCMGWLKKGFPCLGFARLRDRGIPAACEGDMDSLLTMLLFQYAIDRPGFQGNATFDTSRNALWTAHCTAPLKMEGSAGKEAPYLLRGHSEIQGSGCVPEVHYRVGQIITRTKLINLDTILASTGKIIDVPKKSVRGCRSQIVTEVRDAARMAANWSSALDTEDAMTLPPGSGGP